MVVEGTAGGGGDAKRDGEASKAVRLEPEPDGLANLLEPMPVEAGAKGVPESRPVDAPRPEEGALADRFDPERVWEERRLGWLIAPIGWIGLVGLLIAGFGYWTLTRIVGGERHLAAETERLGSRLRDNRREEEAARSLLAQVEARVRAYLAADQVEEKLKYVRHPERVRPHLERYYQSHELKGVELESIQELHPVTIGRRPFFFLRARDIGGGTHALILEDGLEGGVRFDWESEVCYQPMPFDEFIARRPLEAMDFRVYLEVDRHYAYEFADQERYQSLYLTTRDSDEHLFGYVERGSEVADALRRFVERHGAGKKLPAYLRLRFLPDSRAPRGVLVEAMLAPRWTLSGDPAVR